MQTLQTIPTRQNEYFKLKLKDIASVNLRKNSNYTSILVETFDGSEYTVNESKDITEKIFLNRLDIYRMRII